VPRDFDDRIALPLIWFLRVFADRAFVKRYGHRAAVPKAVAVVQGIVAGIRSVNGGAKFNDMAAQNPANLGCGREAATGGGQSPIWFSLNNLIRPV